MKIQNKRSIWKTISLWLIIVGIGIIGTLISLSIIPISLIPLLIGLITAIFGFLIYNQIRRNKCQRKNVLAKDIMMVKIKNNNYLAYSLIFIGFTLAWIFAWFLFLCYFRYSTYMITIYL